MLQLANLRNVLGTSWKCSIADTKFHLPITITVWKSKVKVTRSTYLRLCVSFVRPTRVQQYKVAAKKTESLTVIEMKAVVCRLFVWVYISWQQFSVLFGLTLNWHKVRHFPTAFSLLRPDACQVTPAHSPSRFTACSKI